jgi:peptidoglycan-associated lipoprotein
MKLSTNRHPSRLMSLLAIVTLAALLAGCNPAMTAYKKGIHHFDAGEYALAIGQFEKAQKGTLDAAKLNFYEAESYRLSNRFAEAAPFYKKALDAGSTEANLRLNYAYALKTKGEYAEALSQMQQYVTAAPKTTPKALREKAEREVETLRAIDLISATKNQYTLQNLTALNSPGIEYAPVVAGDFLVYTSSHKETLYKNNNLPMTGLYKVKLEQARPDVATKTSPGQPNAARPEVFSQSVFAGDANEGTPAFSKDGKSMIFARGNNGKRKGGLDVDLYMSRQTETGAWGDPFRLPVSDSTAWDGSPAFSADGRTLYFASNRAGGAGGLDLYRTNMDKSGRFSRPVNMGRDINTPGDEMFPYVSPDAKLYFSSDGHPGLGKLDVFMATRSQGVIRVENLGQPINSPADDFGLVFADDFSGYLASNRTGGQGDDDIYFFSEPDTTQTPTLANQPPKPGDPSIYTGPKTVRYFLAGIVQSGDAPVLPLDSAHVRIIETDEAGTQLADVTTDKPGTFGKFAVQEGKEYAIVVERKGFLTRREPFSMLGRSIPEVFLRKAETDTTFTVIVPLDRNALNRTFVLDNIYYDLNKYNIRSDAAPELDKLVTIMKDNPTLKIELQSHTDARDTDAYNLKLSQNRAKAAVDYIVGKGIDAGRIVAKGYGETQLVIKNAKTEEEHQRNRRTEVKILAL